MTALEPAVTEPEASARDWSIVHTVCCQTPDDAPGVAWCRSKITNLEPPVEGVDLDCAMCESLQAEDLDGCPLGGRCIEAER